MTAVALQPGGDRSDMSFIGGGGGAGVARRPQAAAVAHRPEPILSRLQLRAEPEVAAVEVVVGAAAAGVRFPRSVRARAAAHGAWDRRGFRWSSRHTDASPLTT